MRFLKILKNILGAKKELAGETEKKPLDINALLNLENLNDAVIELDNHISELCDYGDNLKNLNEPQKIFFLNQNFEREINNGGFNQFYYNSSGNFAGETTDSLKSIGAISTFELLQKSNNLFPEQNVPKDREERIQVLESIESGVEQIWTDLENEFYKYEDDLNLLNMEFVKKNKNYFAL